MFGIGFSEIAIILMAALVFINPKDMPAFFRKVGRAMGQLRKWRRELMWTINEIEANDAPEGVGAFGSKVDKDGNFIAEPQSEPEVAPATTAAPPVNGETTHTGAVSHLMDTSDARQGRN
jgi:Sec-independent protein translocase protein TatA